MTDVAIANEVRTVREYMEDTQNKLAEVADARSALVREVATLTQSLANDEHSDAAGRQLGLARHRQRKLVEKTARLFLRLDEARVQLHELGGLDDEVCDD